MIPYETQHKIRKMIELAKKAGEFQVVLNRKEFEIESEEQSHHMFLFISTCDLFSRRTVDSFIISLR